ncbi:DNA/RNA nuclease SfsA [Arhodomonas sp. SL1]|uniref:DNA/RNA nuclease SfsA n=1 Tax=Arhodomonas sp. SL1 TaxID=3425691 RepID=UPI003F884B2B
MEYSNPLREARLVRRYKRFLADVECVDGEALTAHCPNTGSMLGCAEPGLPVWLSHSARAGRKYPWTWEQVAVHGGTRVGIHTGRTNDIVAEAIAAGLFPELGTITAIRREVRVPQADMRADFLLEGDDGFHFAEAKNVTAAVSDGVALFPDAVSTRGSRHLHVLRDLAGAGRQASLIFCVQRDDVTEVRPADAIDPDYGAALRQAREAGVGVYAFTATPDDQGITPGRRVPVVCP